MKHERIHSAPELGQGIVLLASVHRFSWSNTETVLPEVFFNGTSLSSSSHGEHAETGRSHAKRNQSA